MEKQVYSVSLLFRKEDFTTGQYDQKLRVIITPAVSIEEALGIAILEFAEETNGYSLIMRVAITVPDDMTKTVVGPS